MIDFLYPFLEGNLLLFFVFNYHIESLHNTGMEGTLLFQDGVNSVFNDLNSKLTSMGGPQNSGPGLDGSLLIQSDDQAEHIKKYYSVTNHQLCKEYYDQLGCRNFIQEYNRIVYEQDSNSNQTIIKQNIISSYRDLIYARTGMSSNDNYLNMYKSVQLYLWENEILDRAKFFCENKENPRAFISLEYKEQCESYFNFGLNRQMTYNLPVIWAAENGFRIWDVTDMSTFYTELCNDSIWVKLHLLLGQSFMGYDMDLQGKINNYSTVILRVAESFYMDNGDALLCLDQLYKLRVNSYDSKLTDLVLETEAGYNVKLSYGDNMGSAGKVGLGNIYNFAYPQSNGSDYMQAFDRQPIRFYPTHAFVHTQPHIVDYNPFLLERIQETRQQFAHSDKMPSLYKLGLGKTNGFGYSQCDHNVVFGGHQKQ